MTASAQGIDISSDQRVYTAAELEAYDFAFFRATLGTTDSDPNFAANWANGKTAKTHRGAYHELTNLSALASQAAHFIDVARGQGVEPGDMLAVVASDYSGITGAEVKAFADTAAAEFTTSPVLIYSDLAVLPDLAVCTGYPLWVAYYSGTAPKSVAPWPAWKFWQWNGATLDMDAYNGTAAELQSWLDGYANRPKPAPAPKPAPVPAAVWPAGTELQEGSTDYSAVLALQKALNDADEFGARDLEEDGKFGPDTNTAVLNFEADTGLPEDPGRHAVAGPQVRDKLIALGHLTPAGAPVA